MKYAYSYSHFCKLVSDQGINVIISTVSLFDKVRSWNKKNIKSYCEIYVKTELSKIINFKKKENIYNKRKNIMGQNIMAELPKAPNIIISNDFTKSISELSKELIKKLNKKY